MKTLLNSLLLTAFLTLSTHALTRADDQPTTKTTKSATFQSGLYTTSEGKLNIALTKQKGGAVDVRLVNRRGHVLFDELIGKRQTSVRMRLDLSELPDGDYELIISNGQQVNVHTLKLNAQPATAPTRLVALN